MSVFRHCGTLKTTCWHSKKTSVSGKKVSWSDFEWLTGSLSWYLHQNYRWTFQSYGPQVRKMGSSSMKRKCPGWHPVLAISLLLYHNDSNQWLDYFNGVIPRILLRTTVRQHELNNPQGLLGQARCTSTTQSTNRKLAQSYLDFVGILHFDHTLE